MCQSLFFDKIAGNVIKKETLAQLFSCEFCEISKSIFFTEHLRTAASTPDADNVIFTEYFAYVLAMFRRTCSNFGLFVYQTLGKLAFSPAVFLLACYIEKKLGL